MIELLEKEIEAINNNLSILPTNTKKNKLDYNKYIEEKVIDYKNKLEEVERELYTRYDEYLEKYTSNSETIEVDNVDLNSIRIENKNFDSSEKMNINYYIYELGHYYNNDLNKINDIINKLISKFKSVGIILTLKDFNYTEIVNKYMETLFNSEENINNVFESLFWEHPNLINQIELNFRYLYFKNKKSIDKFYSNLSKNNSNNENKYINQKSELKSFQHSSSKYIINQFLDKKIQLSDFSEKNIENLTNEFLLDKDSENNYNNLLKLEDTLIEYKGLNSFMYIIDDLKKLYSNKNEYKGIYLNKYKEITKKEKELFKLNKKITNKFLKNKLGELKLKRNECLNTLYSLYRELDSLKIKDSIFNFVNDDTTYLELLKLCTYNFSYYVKLFKENNNNIDFEGITENINELFEYVYTNEFNIINNISILEDKNISQIVSDRYRLVNIDINNNEIDEDSIDNCIDKIGTLIMNYDLIKNNITRDEINYLLYVSKVKK